MTNQEAIAELRRIAVQFSDDPEVAHIGADKIIRRVLPEDVRAAYDAVRTACRGWWYA